MTSAGLYCPAGQFFIDPTGPVDFAVVTHAHSDHVTRGCKSYLTSRSGLELVAQRLRTPAVVTGVSFGETVTRNDVSLSLHPAGHVLGSAQVRVEHRGEVWVVSGDYRCTPDPTCEPFEPVRCHTFITECTFGEPRFAWRPQSEVIAEVEAWWRRNQAAGRTSVLFAYALGKAQRILAAVNPELGPIVVHGAVNVVNNTYRRGGIVLPDVRLLPDFESDAAAKSGPRPLVVAPPTAHFTGWFRRLGESHTAFASGWMDEPGALEDRQVERGFVLSDHADFAELHCAVAATGASRVYAVHGAVDAFSASVRSRGREASPLPNATHSFTRR
jgi:putative mRNA 3-end processing factor